MFFPKLESESLRDSRAFFTLEENIRVSTGYLLFFNILCLRVVNILSFDCCASGLGLYAGCGDRRAVRQSKFLINCLIKYWHNVAHVNIIGISLLIQVGEIRGCQLEHMPLCIINCQTTTPWLVLYLRQCLNISLFFWVLPFKELDIAGSNVSFYVIISLDPSPSTNEASP